MRADLDDVLPLTPLQEGMLFHGLYDQAADVYTEQVSFDLAGELSVATLKQACCSVLERHASLRAGFRVLRSGAIVQGIASKVSPVWHEVDLRAQEMRHQKLERDRKLREERTKPFDMTRPPLIRFLLLRLANDRHVFAISNHHILLDGWSLSLLIQEIMTLYSNGGNVDKLKPAPSYRDYFAWLAGWDRDGAVQAWKQAMEGLDEPTRIAQSGAGPATEQQEVSVELSRKSTEAIKAYTRLRSLTVNILLQGVWGVLLGSRTRRDDVVFGATISTRQPEIPGVENLVGLFINTTPVRVRLNPQEPVEFFLKRLQGEQVSLLPHQHLGLVDIQGLTGLGQLFDTHLVFENYPTGSAELQELAPAFRVTDTATANSSHYPLSVVAVIRDERLELHFHFAVSLFDRVTVEGIARRFVGLLEQVAGDASLTVGQLELLSEAERR
ncbi:condensation domain-containing protein, partial [Streptomyces sp. NPDC048215]|uniref:condensation domain-containing protein n=1 Tax=Streptomyces sp. NPDC048215 TaxID=3156690 RepID=UPI0033C2428C